MNPNEENKDKKPVCPTADSDPAVQETDNPKTADPDDTSMIFLTEPVSATQEEPEDIAGDIPDAAATGTGSASAAPVAGAAATDNTAEVPESDTATADADPDPDASAELDAADTGSTDDVPESDAAADDADASAGLNAADTVSTDDTTESDANASDSNGSSADGNDVPADDAAGDDSTPDDTASDNENNTAADDDIFAPEDPEISPLDEPRGLDLNLHAADDTDLPHPDADKTSGSAAVAKKPKNRKKLWIILGSVAAVLVCAYLIGVWRFSQVFMPGTYVDGFSVANKTVAETEQIIQSGTPDRTVTITGSDGKTADITAGDIDLAFSNNLDLAGVIAQQNPWSWPVALVGAERIDLASKYTYSEDKLDKIVSQSSFVTGSDIVATENAQASYNNGTYVIKDEVYGTQVDQDKLKQAVLDDLISGTDKIDLKQEKLYVQPSVTADSAQLKSSVEKLNKIASTVITYKFGNQTETLDKNTFINWLSTDADGNVQVDSNQAAAYVKELADKYDTLYTYQNFNTTGGGTVEVYAAGYGWEIDQEAETEQLVSLISEGSTTTREPVYDSEGADRTSGNAVGGDYIEISISAQTMYCYKNGSLVVSTPVTTGTVSSGYGTPTGIYQIAYKDTNVTLSGDNGDGSSYASPVTYWIPFNGGIGIHDASWRSNYGGDLYLTSGSHGCVNTPYAAVETIYSNCEAGEPVVVY